VPSAKSKPSERLGDYELLHELKTGGMGSIYLARKRATGGFEKLLAIKTIRPELSERTELRTMFLDEARLLARLEHPAVAQVYDFGEQDDTLFLAMEYVAGVRFSDLAELGTPPSLALRLVADVLRALHAAHQLKDLDGHKLEIVHRDVSPDNLMLSFDGHVKVLDFGIALMRGRQAPVTEFGTVKGKPPYLSPEQNKGQRIDWRADIWSASVVLWELLTGEYLFRGDSIYAVSMAVETQEIQPPSALAGQLPEGLDAIVLKGLSRDVEERYQSAQDMADDLLAVAANIAAPSTAEFAGAALQSESDAHRVWLRDVLGGKAAPKPAGRATGMLTIPAEAASDDPVVPATAMAQARDMPAEFSEGRSAEPAPAVEPVPSQRGSRFAGLAVLVALLGAGAWWIVSAGDPPSRAAALAMDAGVAELPPVLVSKSVTLDAALPVVIADAATADARKRKSVTVRDKDKPPALETPDERPPVVKKTPPPPPADTGFGTMTIAAEPFALVRVDGKEIGSTPLFKKRFAAGKHVVELIHPDSGKVRLRRTVDLAVDGHKNIIDR
jgi:serine/threonine-protein kinase